MAPSFTTQGVFALTVVNCIGTSADMSTGSGLVSRAYATVSSDYYCSLKQETTKQETKKQRIARIAKEKMYASWKTYNDRTETIKEIKQICKPRHKVNHMGRRF